MKENHRANLLGPWDSYGRAFHTEGRIRMWIEQQNLGKTPLRLPDDMVE